MDNITVNDFMETDLGPVSPDPRGPYDNTATYEHLSLVELGGGSYLCTIAPGEVITGIAPEPGKTTEYWQVLTIPGSLTPEYIAMHDRVMNAARQTELDRAAVELSEQNVSGMETNVEQMQADVQAGAAQVAKDKDSAAGYAQAAEVSRQATAESEANVNAQVNGFDSHVSQKTTDATGTIETARQQAVDVVKQQGAESTQGVIDDTEAYFEEKKTDALSEISDKTAEVVKSVTDEGAKQIGLVDAAGAAKVAAVTQEGTDQIAGIQAEAESYVKREDANKLAFKGEYEGRSHHVEDSADWGFLGMQGFGESTQVQTTGAQLQSFVDNTVNNYGITFTVAGETISLKGTSTFSGGRSNFTLPATTLPAGTYALSLSESINAVLVVTNTADNSAIKSTQKAVNFTLAEETNISLGFNVESGGTYNISKLRIMLNAGDTALPWEPYTGGAPSPSTAYPQEINSKCEARQLFDASTITEESYLRDTDGQVISVGATAAGMNVSDYIPIAGYDYVTVATNMTEKRWGAFYNADKSFLRGIAGYGTLAVPEGAHFMRLTIADDALDTCMINAGTTPGAWAPYGKYGLETVVTGAQLLDTAVYKPSNVRLIKDDPQELIIQNNDVTTGTLMRIIRFLIPKKIVSAGKITVGFDYAQVGDPQKIGYPAVAISWGNGTKDELKTIGRKTETKQTGTLSYTFELPKEDIENPEYTSLVVWIYSQSVVTTNVLYESKLTIRNLMCNLGESVKPWQLYDEQILRAALDMPLRGIPVSSGGNVTIDGQEYIADYRDWERGKVVRRVTEEVFDGSADEAIANNAGSSGMGGRFSLKSKTTIKAGCGFCNMAEISNYGDSKGKFGTGNYGGTSTMYYIGYSDDEMTVEEFRTLLSANPLVFCVPLATPIETDIPSEELAAYRRLHAYHGTTNIHNSDDVYTAVEYARDPDTYLNNKLAEISAAIIGG